MLDTSTNIVVTQKDQIYEMVLLKTHSLCLVLPSNLGLKFSKYEHIICRHSLLGNSEALTRSPSVLSQALFH